MISLKRKESGFTIVELLIVIVVIGILAALVVTTFSGIQRKARNTERETDIKALHGQLEAYFAQENAYPTLDNMNDADWREENMKGLDAEALRDPNGAAAALCATGTAANTTKDTACYSYVLDGDGIYTLTAAKEGGNNETFEKKGLN